MIPAKSRERKCATCKHYQPSPLWRKGWCRNPLLYDRNTNHLVEAESLSCNRTFIDYWEPGDGSAPTAGAHGRQPRSNKPRIAPSIPMDTVDAEGNRDVVTGNTPAIGLPVSSSKSFYRPTSGRDRPPLSIVNSEPAEEPVPATGAAKTTRQIPKIDYPEDDDLELQSTAQQRVEAERVQKRTTRRMSMPALPISGPMLWIVLVAVVALGLLGGGFLLTRSPGDQPSAATATQTATIPAPTPTGFGDPTPTSNTPPPSPTTAGGATAPPTDKIAVGGWVRVTSNAGLRIRQEPSTSSTIVGRLPSGSTAHVIDGPRESDGYTWWKVDQYSKDDPDASGWCADDFLVPTTPPSP